MLVRTPSPFPTESARGFVLRVSEANGYTTPAPVLTLIGSPSTIMLQPHKINLEALSTLLGVAQRSLDYLTPCDSRRSTERLLGHRLPKSIVKMTRIREIAFCPDCVDEHGFLDALWDLRLVVACPTHKLELLSRCPHCKRLITWSRPGLLQCKCGGSFKGAQRAPASDSVLRLMALIQKTLHELPQPGLTWDYERLHRVLSWLMRETYFANPTRGWLSGHKFDASNIIACHQVALERWPRLEAELRQASLANWKAIQMKTYGYSSNKKRTVSVLQLSLFQPPPRYFERRPPIKARYALIPEEKSA